MIPKTFISINELVQTEKQKFISWYVTMIYHSTMTHSMSLCISFNELDKSWSRWGGGCRSRGHQAGCLRKSLFIIFRLFLFKSFVWKCGHFWHLSTLRTWQIIRNHCGNVDICQKEWQHSQFFSGLVFFTSSMWSSWTESPFWSITAPTLPRMARLRGQVPPSFSFYITNG